MANAHCRSQLRSAIGMMIDDDVCVGARLPARTALAVGVQALGILRHVHAQRLLFCDVKPARRTNFLQTSSTHSTP